MFESHILNPFFLFRIVISAEGMPILAYLQVIESKRARQTLGALGCPYAGIAVARVPIARELGRPWNLFSFRERRLTGHSDFGESNFLRGNADTIVIGIRGLSSFLSALITGIAGQAILL